MKMGKKNGQNMVWACFLEWGKELSWGDGERSHKEMVVPKKGKRRILAGFRRMNRVPTEKSRGHLLSEKKKGRG